MIATYQLAYLPTATVDLCDACADICTREIDDDIGTLGPVQHGAHRGICDRCGS